jgi:hypothetical protein
MGGGGEPTAAGSGAAAAWIRHVYDAPSTPATVGAACAGAGPRRALGPPRPVPAARRRARLESRA